mmetsp:Transcript_47083/g.107361  ORF Transcript_47083/g.107361 Transcript_47083/m.107361 type:complete len:360 (-) Transcript_47083:204-1283(-)
MQRGVAVGHFEVHVRARLDKALREVLPLGSETHHPSTHLVQCGEAVLVDEVHVGLVLQQQIHDLLVARAARHHQWSVPLDVDAVGVGSAGEQHLGRVVEAEVGCVEQRDFLLQVLDFRIDAARDQHLHDLDGLLLGGLMQRSIALEVLEVGFRSRIEQQLRHVRRARLPRPVQRRPPQFRLLVPLLRSEPRNDKRCGLCVPPVSRVVQRGVAREVLGQHVRACRLEHLHHLCCPRGVLPRACPARRPLERRPRAEVALVHVGALRQQPLHLFNVALERSDVQRHLGRDLILCGVPVRVCPLVHDNRHLVERKERHLPLAHWTERRHGRGPPQRPHREHRDGLGVGASARSRKMRKPHRG